MARYSKVVRKKKKSGLARFFPERWQAFVARRLLDAVAAIMVAGGAFILLAVAGYSHTDPSWNTATDNAASIGNWMGAPGAYIADILLQTIGLGALAFGIVLGLWGVRLFRRDTVAPFWTRGIAMVATALFLAMACARLPAGTWLTHAWLGGSG
ncbi:MAG: DNA translocase FtsK 4TM domain-containing protein, partial [Alphaproteobacteria bacterium]|nr:DNA translocase FtsK 4TM domain-containing protein [Alphaproteobacteria bacterium]